MSPILDVLRLPGRIPYGDALGWQRQIADARIAGVLSEDIVLLLEHEPVFTLGRGSAEANLLADSAALEELGYDVFEVERGGDVTYHGPGQLVGYPIIDLRVFRKDLHWYLRTLERSLIHAFSELGLAAFTNAPHTGVWVGAEGGSLTAGEVRKIASIGVHVSRWVTWHGFAINVSKEALVSFDHIVPCGIEAVHMTSLESEGHRPAAGELEGALAAGLNQAFGDEHLI